MPASRYKLCAFLPYASVPMKPRRNRLSIYIFAFCGFLNLILCLDPSASVTIAQLPAWSMQRSCGKGCLQNTYDPGADIEGVLGCSWNGCYCGNQYAATATSIISSCWSAYCGTSDTTILSYDISTAVSIYNEYCFGGGNAPAAAAASTTNQWTTVQSNPTVTSALTSWWLSTTRCRSDFRNRRPASYTKSDVSVDFAIIYQRRLRLIQFKWTFRAGVGRHRSDCYHNRNWGYYMDVL